MDYLASEEALTAFLTSFENGTFPPARWKHAEHVAMAASYLYGLPFHAALTRARDRIRAYNESQGGRNTENSGYHETLTVFWLRIVDRAIDRSLNRAAAVRAIVDRFAPQRDLARTFYSFDIVKDSEARRRWIAPDLREL